MSISEAQKKHLRGLGHQLKPVVMVGDGGLSPSLLEEYEAALSHHELIKVSVRVGARQDRDDIIGDLCSIGSAELIQRVGNMALLYRENPEQKKIVLPRGRQT